MGSIAASAHELLLSRIALVKQKKHLEEEALRQSLKEIASSLKPVALIKESIHELVADKEVKEDLVTAGIKLGTNFLIAKVMGRNHSVKGFFGSMLVEQIASSVISKKVIPFLASLNEKDIAREPSINQEINN